MPHQIIEYSANLETRVDMQALVDSVHRIATQIDVFPLGGLRTRASRREFYKIADGHPDNAFLHLTWKLGSGRSEEVRRSAGDFMFQELCALLATVYDDSPLAVSFEIQEIHPVLTYKKNNLRDYMQRRKDQHEGTGSAGG